MSLSWHFFFYSPEEVSITRLPGYKSFVSDVCRFCELHRQFPKRTVQLLKLQITIVKNTIAQIKGDGLQSDCRRLFFF